MQYGNNIIYYTVLVGIEFGFGTHYYENNRRLITCWVTQYVNIRTILKVFFTCRHAAKLNERKFVLLISGENVGGVDLFPPSEI